MKDETIISIVAMICIAALEVSAIITGIDGAYLLPVVAVVGIISGVELKDIVGDIVINLKQEKEK